MVLSPFLHMYVSLCLKCPFRQKINSCGQCHPCITDYSCQQNQHQSIPIRVRCQVYNREWLSANPISIRVSYQVDNREWLSANPTSIRISYQVDNREWLSANPISIRVSYQVDNREWLSANPISIRISYQLYNRKWLQQTQHQSGSALNCITENDCSKPIINQGQLSSV